VEVAENWRAPISTPIRKGGDGWGELFGYWGERGLPKKTEGMGGEFQLIARVGDPLDLDKIF